MQMMKVSELVLDEIAGLFPELSTEEFETLKRSIRKNGIRTPLQIVRENRVIDGRHRLKAAQELGIEEIPVIFSKEDDSLFVVLDLNCTGRQSTIGQKALVAAEISMNSKRGNQIGKFTDLDQKEAAKYLGISLSSVGKAKTLLLSGRENLIQAVRSGKKPISWASGELKEKNNQLKKVEEPVVEEETHDDMTARKIAEKRAGASIDNNNNNSSLPPSSFDYTLITEELEKRNINPTALEKLLLILDESSYSFEEAIIVFEAVIGID